jgi:hypothetical protein
MMFSRFGRLKNVGDRSLPTTAIPTSVTTRILVWVVELPAELARRHPGAGPRGLGPLVATVGEDSAAVAGMIFGVLSDPTIMRPAARRGP